MEGRVEPEMVPQSDARGEPFLNGSAVEEQRPVCLLPVSVVCFMNTFLGPSASSSNRRSPASSESERTQTDPRGTQSAPPDGPRPFEGACSGSTDSSERSSGENSCLFPSHLDDSCPLFKESVFIVSTETCGYLDAYVGFEGRGCYESPHAPMGGGGDSRDSRGGAHDIMRRESLHPRLRLRLRPLPVNTEADTGSQGALTGMCRIHLGMKNGPLPPSASLSHAPSC
ncbi:hypothetical protein EYF80_047828 [Liparis tanakae]|uniref:Uncharacterized protein n=1 Tax=Liparis tanakae TaxID=230148 RepID=A0A4Z2FMG7_9TELE|nr:hypothetical protein EYF80_047828 [Liparis tanakae]